MTGQIRALVRLELCGVFGLNALRHTKDPKARRKAYTMAGIYLFLILAVFLYVGALSYGLVMLGAAEAVGAYLIAISSILTFFFGIFTAGSTLFSRNGYDILCSIPVSQTAIVISRFLRMYTENLALTLAVMVPAMAVYAWLLHPGACFYLNCVVGTLSVPLLPVAAAALVGAAVAAISSRMKHKSLVEAALSILLVLGIFSLTPELVGLEGDITPQMLEGLSATVLNVLGKIYPPSVWLGTAIVRGNIAGCLGCACVCAMGFLAVVSLISLRFHAICRRLFSSPAKHDYRMERLKKDSVLISLCRREFKRYFASGVYVSNTIMGPILGTVLSGAVLFMDVDRISQVIPIQVDIPGLVPFLAAGIFCITTTSSVSVSMEGKSWWIVKTLPLSTKNILDAKLLMNLMLILPFYLVSQVLLGFALKPNFLELVWQVSIPAVVMLFSCVYGITINLRLPMLDWEREAAVVKQSAASMLGGMGGLLVAVLCAGVIALIPQAYSDLTKLVICVVLFGITAMLYRQNNRTDLKQL